MYFSALHLYRIEVACVSHSAIYLLSHSMDTKNERPIMNCTRHTTFVGRRDGTCIPLMKKIISTMFGVDCSQID